MKIFVYVHMWPPNHCAGSEVTVHAAMRELVSRGHEVTTIADQTPESYEYEGVKVLSVKRDQYHHANIREAAQGSDILITHLDCTSLAMQLHLDMHRPLVHFVHNHLQIGFHSVPPNKAQLLIYNSDWIAKRQEYKDKPWPGASVVIHPIVEPDRYKCKPGTKITLCNPTDGKGIATLHKLAEAMPDYEFLVVEGIYGEQIAPPNLGDEWVLAHPNVEHMKNSPDFRDVLRKTKVLLMPSNYESYGRCAVEAACAGIPSIVHPTEGLLESLNAERTPTDEELQGGWVSGAGVFCDRADVPSWKAQIERLYSDEVYYRSRSDVAVKLANSLDPEAEFDRLEAALLETIKEWNKREEVKIVAMWTPDVRLWETSEGKLVREINGRIPQNAMRLWGLEPIPEDVAIANGLISTPEGKAIEAPAENKAIEAPEENKGLLHSGSITRGRKKKTA